MSLKDFEFAIKKETLNSGKVIHIPVVRKKGGFGTGLRIIQNSWNRISLVEGKYMLLELDFTPELTFEECEQRVEGYKNVITDADSTKILVTEFLKLEEKNNIT